MLLDLENGNPADGTNIRQWGKLGVSPQEWRIIAENDGYCRIASMVDESKCVSVSENSGTNGLNVELQTFTGSDNQLWKLIRDGSRYGIVSKCSDDKSGLDVFEMSTEYGANIDQWEYWGGDCQLWSIQPVYPQINSGVYTVRNVNSGLFAAESSGNAVQSKSQNLTFTRLDEGNYTISTADGKALTVENNSSEDGANVSFSDYTGDDSQKFSLIANKDGSYSILTVSSDGKRCVDVYNISTDDGANLCQWEYWGGEGQKFVIEPVPKETEIRGDINADGKFNIADVVLLQKWLLAVPVVHLDNWEAGDFFEDGRVNVFDLCLMKRELTEK